MEATATREQYIGREVIFVNHNDKLEIGVVTGFGPAIGNKPAEVLIKVTRRSAGIVGRFVSEVEVA